MFDEPLYINLNSYLKVRRIVFTGYPLVYNKSHAHKEHNHQQYFVRTTLK